MTLPLVVTPALAMHSDTVTVSNGIEPPVRNRFRQQRRAGGGEAGQVEGLHHPARCGE